MTEKEFNKLFDHTILHPTTTEAQLKEICKEVIRYGFCSIAVNTGMVSACARFLEGSDIKVDAAVGFPLGITTIELKAAETEEAIKNGASEIDYLVNIGKVKEGDFEYIKKEMETIVAICRKHRVVSKAIFENCYLTDEEKIMLCRVADSVKPDYIKTSTGFGPSSATVEDVRLMRENTCKEVKVKAAGGVRDLKSCYAMLEAGAERIGCSSSTKVADEFKNTLL